MTLPKLNPTIVVAAIVAIAMAIWAGSAIFKHKADKKKKEKEKEDKAKEAKESQDRGVRPPLPPERSEDTKGPGRLAPVTNPMGGSWINALSLAGGKYCTPEAAAQGEVVLKVGVKAKDAVKCLQEQLGVLPDGSFGPKTQAALKAQKGVTQITLKDYFTPQPV